MTLKLTPIDHQGLCHGWTWTIEDEDLLAEHVARVALGQARHVAKILNGCGLPGPTSSVNHAADAIKLLSVKTGDKSWHRDGWIFQTISWIAAHHHGPGAVIRQPQIRLADKGFDGMQLEISSDGRSVTAVIIFEDKATDHARKTITAEVWPGIVDLEAGKRVNELTAEVSAVLEAQQRSLPDLDVDKAIDTILWKEARRYRVSITTGDTHLKPAARARLFKGFNVNAPGDASRRRAETLYIPDLRAWMDSFAGSAIAKLKAISGHV